MNILALFLFWVLARTHYSINKVLSDTKYPDPERFIGVQANIRLLHTQNAKRFRRPLSPGGSLCFRRPPKQVQPYDFACQRLAVAWSWSRTACIYPRQG